MKMLNILLIEDDAIELMKFKRVLNKLELNHKITEAENGKIALDILNAKEIIPNIIILDLNMPKLNGIEFLEILKNDEQLRNIPAIVLTTSNNYRDVLECYKIGIAGYVLKPLKYDDYLEQIKRMLQYWSINELVSQ